MQEKEVGKKLTTNNSDHKGKKKIRLKQVMKQFHEFKKLTQDEQILRHPDNEKSAKILKVLESQGAVQSQKFPIQNVLYHKSPQLASNKPEGNENIF